MICYGVAKLRESGIRDIVIVTGRSALGGFADVLGGGRDWGVSITYRIQEEAGGIAQALELTRPLIAAKDKFIVLRGDNLFEDSLRPYLEQFQEQPGGAMVLIKKTNEPKCATVPKLDQTGSRILYIEDEPDQPPSKYCVTGIFFYDTEVFDLIEKVKPSRRGELEISDVHNAYAAAGRLSCRELSGWWTDVANIESLEEAGRRLKGTIP
jgi:glucose-1-phosphate thymidylyltransferase